MSSYEQELLEEGKCPDLVMISTEDGPVTGRCMQPTVLVLLVDGTAERFACEGHSRERLEWMSLSEIERLDVERREDDLR